MTQPASSDAVQIATLVVTFLGTVFTGVMAYLVARLNVNQRARAATAAAQTEEVKQTLRENLAAAAVKVEEVKHVAAETAAKVDASAGAADRKLDQIHTLVNNKMGLALAAVADLSRWKADQPGAPAGSREAADRAEADYRDHMSRQAVIDSQSSYQRGADLP